MNKALREKLDNYKTPEAARRLIEKTRIVFLVGTAGAGKDTVRTKLLLTGKYHHIISHTTRPPRANHGVMELDGTDYHFVREQELEAMLDKQEFVEAKEFSGNVYGTSIAEIQKAHDENKIAITDLEVQGVAEYRAISDSVIPVFLLPPNYDVWQQRLRGRYVENQIDADDITRRMQTARMELQEALDKPYFEYVVNDDLDTTVRVVDEIAHGQFSDKKNQRARQLAQELLNKIPV